MRSEEKKVLIITYYWPPSGGSGVQRWLKFVKYLPSFGWHPHVFTPENPSFEMRDDTLLKDVPQEAEVIHFPIWEPYGIFRKASAIAGKRGTKQTDFVTTGKKSIFQSVTSWIRGNLFVPDARIFWVKPSVEFLEDFIRANSIRTIITTGPPHSLHLIGLKLKKADPSIRWIADLRDPWSEWDFLDTLSLTVWARKRHQRLECDVLQSADRVITIAPFHVNRFEDLGGRKVDLITNGFDEDDFQGIQRVRTDRFTVRHIGMVDELRDPRPFIQAVKELLREQPDLAQVITIEFIGSVNTAFRNFVESDSLLSGIVGFRDPVSHNDLLRLYGETDAQLLVLAHTALAPGNLPGKMFEYLASGNFILGIGPHDGDAARVLDETRAGRMVERTDLESMKSELLRCVEDWKKGQIRQNRNVRMYARKQLTGQLAELLDKE